MKNDYEEDYEDNKPYYPDDPDRMIFFEHEKSPYKSYFIQQLHFMYENTRILLNELINKKSTAVSYIDEKIHGIKSDIDRMYKILDEEKENYRYRMLEAYPKED